ncbi:MAG: tRNA (adenosine(37)-N6)-dimethylallyltransferase MiaA [Gammaproteobacteria bacterium]|nr:tRNA (adenosine(37)-N6)-dimethylallyltransferase MiaA [Gammaproteobacteria bacterium]
MNILCVLGPTAIGKTALVVECAEKLGIEIVSLDSALVYRELTIGANKPSKEELEQCPHHVIDCVSVAEAFHIGKYIQYANEAVSDILSRGKVPVIVGGTMMYAYRMKTGLQATQDLSIEAKQELRAYWANRPVSEAYEYLQSLQPEKQFIFHSHDKQRTLRQIEIALAANRQHSDIQQDIVFKWPIDFYSLDMADRELHRKILKIRLDNMIKNGFLDEVAILLKKYPDELLPFWRFVGYRQFRGFCEGSLTYEDAVDQAYFATCHLAKHQRTWMRKLQTKELIVKYNQAYMSDELTLLLEKYAASFQNKLF